MYSANLQYNVTYPTSTAGQYVSEQTDLLHHQHRVLKNIKYLKTTGELKGIY
jgi:hypothetical protein